MQLNTAAKLFCSCSSAGEDAAPNTLICSVCTARPGAMPYFSREAVEKSVKAALSLNLKINNFSVFSRKNYFYPDLAKGFQITQHNKPLAEKGFLDVNGARIGITRAHIEEDTAKSLHKADYSLVDFNRSGLPLLEIVTEPDIRAPQQAYDFLTGLKHAVKWAGVSDADMEKGQLRVDVNISLRKKGEDAFGVKVEIKNLNSFKAVKDALEYEIERQSGVLSSGGKVKQETMTFDKDAGVTRPMRSKESAVDYRYFSEPDLPPLRLEEAYIEEIRAQMPAPPGARRKMFCEEYKISDYDAGVMTLNRALADYFEETVKFKAAPKSAANWLSSDMLGKLNARGIEITSAPLTPQQLAELIIFTDSGAVSRAQAKKIFDKMWEEGGKPGDWAQKLGLAQVSDTAQLEAWVKEAVAENPKAAQDVKDGKDKAISAIVGGVMKKSKGKANPALVSDIIKKQLS